MSRLKKTQKASKWNQEIQENQVINDLKNKQTKTNKLSDPALANQDHWAFHKFAN